MTTGLMIAESKGSLQTDGEGRNASTLYAGVFIPLIPYVDYFTPANIINEISLSLCPNSFVRSFISIDRTLVASWWSH